MSEHEICHDEDGHSVDCPENDNEGKTCGFLCFVTESLGLGSVST